MSEPAESDRTHRPSRNQNESVDQCPPQRWQDIAARPADGVAAAGATTATDAVGPGWRGRALGFKTFRTAAATIMGIELAHMIRQGQARPLSHGSHADQFYALAA